MQSTLVCFISFLLLLLCVSTISTESSNIEETIVSKRSPYRTFAFAKRAELDEDDFLAKRAQYGFAKRNPYRSFAFAKRASPYGFAFAKRSQLSSFA